MTAPTPEEQVAFLANLQRILGEGSFVATYKHALLLALADLSVELGNDSGAALVIPLTAIAEKFIAYYWRPSHTRATMGFSSNRTPGDKRRS